MTRHVITLAKSETRLTMTCDPIPKDIHATVEIMHARLRCFDQNLEKIFGKKTIKSMLEQTVMVLNLLSKFR